MILIKRTKVCTCFFISSKRAKIRFYGDAKITSNNKNINQ